MHRETYARQSRIDAAGALHHIIVRGIERRKVFIDWLGAILSQTGTQCFAWALIPNHILC